jgi:outer membrane protein OmpA-like peptidoglycan-associated protein
MKNAMVICSALCVSLLLCGCAAVIIGAGAAGAGAFAFTKGKLSRTYEYGYHETINASIATLESLKIPVEDKIGDELKTFIFAKRPDGTPVNVEVLRISPNATEVAIRTGKIGVLDKKTSYQIHDFILNRLNKNLSKTSIPDEWPQRKTGIIERDISDTISESEPPFEANAHKSKPLTVYFDVNTNSLSGSETNKLDLFIEDLNKRPALKIIIIGYSDATGQPQYNKMLSLSRAETVQMYLIGKGVPPGQTEIFGRGSLFFVSSNATEEGRRLNRRVEIFIEHKEGQN